MAISTSSFGLGLYGSPPTSALTATASSGGSVMWVGISQKATNCKNCGGPLNWLKRACEYCHTYFC